MKVLYSERIVLFVATLAAVQSARLYNRAFARMSEGDGYQPFGYDWPTMRLTRPAWAVTLRAIAQGHNGNVRREKGGAQ